MVVSTGWYGIPGAAPSRATKVHVVVNGKPACGVHLHPQMEYQWCSHGVQTDYLECGRCRNMLVWETVLYARLP